MLSAGSTLSYCRPARCDAINPSTGQTTLGPKLLVPFANSNDANALAYYPGKGLFGSGINDELFGR